jgi:hypothetical protein
VSEFVSNKELLLALVILFAVTLKVGEAGVEGLLLLLKAPNLELDFDNFDNFKLCFSLV